MVEPQAFVRTGILHVPVMDGAAGEAVSRKLITGMGHVVIQQESYAASDRRWLEETLCKWCDEDELDLLLTIGGTLPAPGPSALEVMPEATSSVIERLMPGIAEAMRAAAREEFPGAALHRGVAGIRGRTLIVNLPGGARSSALFLEAILEDLPYVLAHLRGDRQALTMEQIIREAEGEGDPAPDLVRPVDSSEAEEPPEETTGKGTGRGLKADEFAAFLRRGKEDAGK